MARRELARGDVLVVRFPIHQPLGREQEGRRPAVLVGLPWEPVRYPVALVVPLTTQPGGWAARNPHLYPQLPSGAGGLTVDSIALLDQIRSLDVTRIDKFLGSLPDQHRETVLTGLRRLLA